MTYNGLQKIKHQAKRVPYVYNLHCETKILKLTNHSPLRRPLNTREEIPDI